MKFCIGVILYYPNELDIQKIFSYINTVDKVFVFDNTDNECNENSIAFASYSNIQYVSNGENLGVARALNELCNQAIYNGYDYIITMDQDSIFKNSDILNLIKYISNNKFDDLGIIAPKVHYLNKKSEVNNMCSTKITHKQEATLVDWVITSGSAINLKNFKITEGFDEKYFIDRVDYDYCMQLKTIGKKILIINNSFLYQQLGEGTQNFFGFSYSEHSALRNYYAFRNRLYYADKYMRGFRKLIYKIVASIKHLILIIVFDKKKCAKLKMLKWAFIDYTNGKMYKYTNN